MEYTFAQWLAADGERVLLELSILLRKAGVEIGDLQALRDFVDSLTEE